MNKKVEPIRGRLQLLRTVCRVYANEKLISDWAVKVKLGERGECQHGRFFWAQSINLGAAVGVRHVL